MAKKKARQASTDRKYFQNLSLDEQVRQAMPKARRLIREGIDPCERFEDTIVEHVAALAHDDRLVDEYRDAPEPVSSTLYERLVAAQALGIALG